MNDIDFTDDELALMESVVYRTLDRSEVRRRSPRVVTALLELGFQEDELAQLMDVTQATISNWKRGTVRISRKKFDKLYLILDTVLVIYHDETEDMSERSRKYLQYRLSNAKGALTVRKRYYQ